MSSSITIDRFSEIAESDWGNRRFHQCDAGGGLMADKELEAIWKRAGAHIEDDDPDAALRLLREKWSEFGDQSTTYRLAGDAKAAMARDAGSRAAKKSLYRQARKHYKEAMKLPGGDKQTRKSLAELENEMMNERITSSKFPKLVSESTPTFWGIIAGLLILLGFIWVLSQIKADETAIITVEWTDSDGVQQSGEIVIELYPDKAPKTVESFKKNANSGYYDAVPFHRIIDSFMVQTGDFENQDGTGGHAAKWFGEGYGYEDNPSTWVVPDEYYNGLKHKPGALSMANTGEPNSGGSQFFIVDANSTPSHLNGHDEDGNKKACGTVSCHTVFGQVIKGMDIVDAISQVQVDGQTPVMPVVMVNIEIQD